MRFFYNSGQWSVASGPDSVAGGRQFLRLPAITTTTEATEETRLLTADHRLLATEFLQMAEAVGGDQEHEDDGAVVGCVDQETRGY
jgi:hypothetical protein